MNKYRRSVCKCLFYIGKCVLRNSERQRLFVHVRMCERIRRNEWESPKCLRTFELFAYDFMKKAEY